MSFKKNYPLLPLRDMVLFPGSVASLFVGREKSMEAVRLAMEANRLIVLATQKKTETVLPQAQDLYQIGVVAEILQLLKMPDGTYKLLLEGLHRVNIEVLHNFETHAEVEVSDAEALYGGDSGSLSENSIRSLLSLFEKYNSDKNLVPPDFFAELAQKKENSRIIDAIAHLLDIPFEQKQNILETVSALERAEKVRVSLENQLDIQRLENSIHEKVRQQMDKMQRHYYINEQIRALKEELGESDTVEFDSYRRRLSDVNLPVEVREKGEQELRKLEKTPAMSAESTVLRNYLDWLCDLPWGKYTEDNKDIKRAQQILDESHYGLEKIKDRMLEFIAVRQLAQRSRGPILCLVGPPGVGKTSLARTLAKCLGRKFIRISLGGVRDEAEIRGHRRTYIGALPGRIISALKKAGSANPVILLDEIDKMSADFRGNPAAALLEALDPEQNSEFIDHYLEVAFDLSQVLFVATANVIHTIPEPLLDRLEVISLAGYTEEEKIQIARRYLLPRQIEDNGIGDVEIKYSTKSLSYIIRHYTKEAGVRQLDRELAQVSRKIARELLEKRQSGDNGKLEYPLDKKHINRFLGPEKYDYNRREKDAAVGKIHGLAWTQAGGDVLNVEVALAHGKGNLILTGNLGEVMKESASTALGYVRSVGHLLGLSEDFFEKNDIYIHVPEGAIPKDGPSAGITIATALVSALTQKPVRHTIAMTGEITLRGMVLSIGGLKEKSLAAFRAGIEEIICPKENEKDLVEIPASVREKIKFHLVENMRQVLELAIVSNDGLFRERQGYPFYARHLPSVSPSQHN